MQNKNPYVRTIYRSSCWRLHQKAGSGFLMLNKIIRFCLFYSGTRWCPRCIAFDRRIYCEKEQFGGFLWRTFYYAVKKDPYLSKDPVICLTKKGNSVYVCLFYPVYLSYVGIIQIRFSGRNGITSPLSRLSPAPRQQYKGCLGVIMYQNRWKCKRKFRNSSVWQENSEKFQSSWHFALHKFTLVW